MPMELTTWPTLLNSFSDGELLAEMAKYFQATWLKLQPYRNKTCPYVSISLLCPSAHETMKYAMAYVSPRYG